MTSYSAEALRKLNKDDLISLILQSKMEYSNPKVLEELIYLHKKFDKFEADVAVTINANLLLPSCLVDTERQRWKNTHYSRRETLEIVGLPKYLTTDAETKVCQNFQSQ